ncbi:MAG: hypothetical protein M3466_15980, partial [Gemmatimonadota bacterium]|nr:hypothetical protein [Gemmatimonadota bacterium]
AELGNIERIGQRRWTITSSADVTTVASSILKTFERVGLPYLEQLGDPDRALEALSKNDRTAWLHSPFHDSRCKRIVALAVAYGKSDRVRDLISSCRKFLAEREDPGLKEFTRFLESLEQPFSMVKDQ